jgi:hypothetical protein
VFEERVLKKRTRYFVVVIKYIPVLQDKRIVETSFKFTVFFNHPLTTVFIACATR